MTRSIPHSRHGRPRQRAALTVPLVTILRILAGRGPAPRPHSPRGSRHHATRRGERPWFVWKELKLLQLGIFVLVANALVLVGWDIVGQRAARDLARFSPTEALTWVKDEPAASDQLALGELSRTDGDLGKAREWAQRSLHANPLDDQALFLLALIAQRQHDSARADAVLKEAGARTWRNLGTQLLLLQLAVGRQDYKQALQHADAIFRVNILNTPVMNSVFPIVATLVARPSSFGELARLLAEAPPWRALFLGFLVDHPASQSSLDELFSRLAESKNPPTNDELKPYIDHLINAGRYEDAHQFWVRLLPASQRSNDRYPYNGNFKFPLDGMPFNWALKPIEGAEISVVQPAGEKTNALLVQFSGARVDFSNVAQLMQLSSGRYKLSGVVKANELQTSRGLWWRIYCADEPKQTLAHTDLISGDFAWTEFSFDFEVPAEGCKAQWLRLELPARIASEREIEGQVWFKQMQITTVPGQRGEEQGARK